MKPHPYPWIQGRLQAHRRRVGLHSCPQMPGITLEHVPRGLLQGQETPGPHTTGVLVHSRFLGEEQLAVRGRVLTPGGEGGTLSSRNGEKSPPRLPVPDARRPRPRARFHFDDATRRAQPPASMGSAPLPEEAAVCGAWDLLPKLTSPEPQASSYCVAGPGATVATGRWLRTSAPALGCPPTRWGAHRGFQEPHPCSCSSENLNTSLSAACSGHGAGSWHSPAASQKSLEINAITFLA